MLPEVTVCKVYARIGACLALD